MSVPSDAAWEARRLQERKRKRAHECPLCDGGAPCDDMGMCSPCRADVGRIVRWRQWRRQAADPGRVAVKLSVGVYLVAYGDDEGEAEERVRVELDVVNAAPRPTPASLARDLGDACAARRALVDKRVRLRAEHAESKLRKHAAYVAGGEYARCAMTEKDIREAVAGAAALERPVVACAAATHDFFTAALSLLDGRDSPLLTVEQANRFFEACFPTGYQAAFNGDGVENPLYDAWVQLGNHLGERCLGHFDAPTLEDTRERFEVFQKPTPTGLVDDLRWIARRADYWRGPRLAPVFARTRAFAEEELRRQRAGAALAARWRRLSSDPHTEVGNKVLARSFARASEQRVGGGGVAKPL